MKFRYLTNSGFSKLEATYITKKDAPPKPYSLTRKGFGGVPTKRRLDI